LISSKEVNKQLNSSIKPILKEQGFQAFTARTFWRYADFKIDILNFQSFNSYHADLMGSTTFSFCVNLSVFITCVRRNEFIKTKGDLLIPHEADGHFRKRLEKSLNQENFPNKQLWYLDEDGNNLEEVISNAREQIVLHGLTWFEEFKSLQYIFNYLKTETESMQNTWGFGKMDSPNRNELLAYIAYELGNYQESLEYFIKVLGFYVDKPPFIQFAHHDKKVLELRQEIDRITQLLTK
jgi:tetratricopeptide (TPR) repeat protein